MKILQKSCKNNGLNNVKQESLIPYKNKKQWFKENWMSVSKPKHAGVRDLINKKIIYSTEHITEMNISETKTKEETFTDLILDTAESSKDTTENQDKATPTTS